ncbi:unnamed protein product [Paramecium octaurelia]|uniref:Casein kinase I n=1 Tax=Paramecium octaurelia TaxID=43137 RepID=A0A8S1X8H4_PAROT|nr:unnamed protein product [Paramecium octaurelia]
MNLNSQPSQIRYQNVRLVKSTLPFFEYFAVQKSSKREVILKIQNSINSNVLQQETAKLIQVQDIEGIPEVIDYGNNNGQRYFLATQSLGPTLSSIIKTNGQMSLKNILLIGVQLIKLIQKIHNKNFILCSLTPSNLCFGSDTEDKLIYLKDLSFFQTNEEECEIQKFPIREINFLSPYFIIARSPRYIDDLYSLAYLLLYLLNGTLPWQQFDNILNKTQFEELQNQKIKVINDQTFLNSQPSIFGEWFKYLNSLKQSQLPNYIYLRNILISKIYENGWKPNEQILYKSDIMKNSSKSIVSIKSRSRGTSVTKTPNQKMIDILSPIYEVDKEFELAQSIQKQKDGLYYFQQLQNLQNSMEDQQLIENNISFTSIEQNESELWKKMEKLDKISNPIKMMNKFGKT